MANILVVENNRGIVDLLEEILASGGHRVSVAYSGMQASRLLKKRPFDAAFIDLGLPDIDGLSLIRELKANHNPAVPIVISGRSDIGAAVDSFRAGAFDYILNPFDIDDILRAVNAIHPKSDKAGGAEIESLPPDYDFKNRAVNVFLNHVMEPALVSLSFFISLVIQNTVLPYQAPITVNAIKTFIFLSICVGFCWGFIAQYYRNVTKMRSPLLSHLFRLGGTYLLLGTILFFVFPMANCRPAMICGFIIGLALLAVTRLLIIPKLTTIANLRKEGRRRIFIVGKGPRADGMYNNLQRHFGEKQVKRIMPGETIEEKSPKKRLSKGGAELYLDAGLLGHDEIKHLINDFGGERVIVNIQESKSEDEKRFTRV